MSRFLLDTNVVVWLLLGDRERVSTDAVRALEDTTNEVSLSAASLERATELWETDGRESEPPSFGWLSSELAPLYPSTLHLKTNVHTRPVGERPAVELEATDHPLAVEQREGITITRVIEIANALTPAHP